MRKRRRSNSLPSHCSTVSWKSSPRSWFRTGSKIRKAKVASKTPLNESCIPTYRKPTTGSYSKRNATVFSTPCSITQTRVSNGFPTTDASQHLHLRVQHRHLPRLRPKKPLRLKPSLAAQDKERRLLLPLPLRGQHPLRPLAGHHRRRPQSCSESLGRPFPLSGQGVPGHPGNR